MPIESELVERTMHLSSEDRAELARRLILSLEPGGIEAQVDQAWEVEIERRTPHVAPTRLNNMSSFVARGQRGLIR